MLAIPHSLHASRDIRVVRRSVDIAGQDTAVRVAADHPAVQTAYGDEVGGGRAAIDLYRMRRRWRVSNESSTAQITAMSDSSRSIDQ